MIIAVVVTFNRLENLKILLSGLQQQSILPDEIIVVNNNSTDGTGKWLDTQNGIIVIHQENTGGAGGFHTGVKVAYERNADWIWIMDDDVIPQTECLEKLLSHKQVSKCLNPVRISHDGQIESEERDLDPESSYIVNYNNRSYKNGKNIWFRNIGTFEGMLIAKDIVEKIGFPDKRFFITHDDLIYGYLAQKYTNVAVVGDALMYRQQVEKSERSNYAYQYYKLRNLWIIEEYLNEENSELKAYRHRRVIWHFLYEIYKVFRLNEFKSKRKVISVYWTAYKDYRAKKYGKGPL